VDTTELSAGTRRCLITERHDWETGGREQQLQFVLHTARDFFGSEDSDRTITVRFHLPPNGPVVLEKDITISRKYEPSGTRRTNGFPEIGLIPPSFVFFEETAERDVYDVWIQEDKAIVAAHYSGWIQGRDSQHGRGRLSLVVEAPVDRPIGRV
jgi:hypothetical protein